MDQFQIWKGLHSECLLFIHKGCHEKVNPGYAFTFCLSNPELKEDSLVYTKYFLKPELKLNPSPLNTKILNTELRLNPFPVNTKFSNLKARFSFK